MQWEYFTIEGEDVTATEINLIPCKVRKNEVCTIDIYRTYVITM